MPAQFLSICYIKGAYAACWNLKINCCRLASSLPDGKTARNHLVSAFSELSFFVVVFFLWVCAFGFGAFWRRLSVYITFKKASQCLQLLKLKVNVIISLVWFDMLWIPHTETQTLPAAAHRAWLWSLDALIMQATLAYGAMLVFRSIELLSYSVFSVNSLWFHMAH